MPTLGAGEFDRHFGTPEHRNADVTYRFQNGLTVFNRLHDPKTLSAEQEADYLSRVFRGHSEEFSFPEFVLPQCTGEVSRVSLPTMVNCLMELMRCGGSYVLMCKLWGCFRSTLGPEDPLYSLMWSLKLRLECVSFRLSFAMLCFLVCYAPWVRGLYCLASTVCHSMILTALSTVLLHVGG